MTSATVARLTPDQKVACSNHVRVSETFLNVLFRNPSWKRDDNERKRG